MVSVIIPTHNRASVLRRALDSVLCQDFNDFEVIVVDDGSTDSTFDLIELWQKQSAFSIRYFKTENRGVSAARNFGAREARGLWLAFLDSDDEWLPHKLSAQMNLTKEFRWVHGEEVWIRNGVRVNAMKKHAKAGGRQFLRSVELCCISPSTVLIERELFASAGGFREDFPVCEDYELWLRLAAREEIGFISEPLIRKYGGHDDQLSRRYKAMDFFRVKALRPFLSSWSIGPEERKEVARSIAARCEILLKGFEKHDNRKDRDYVRLWAEEARNALTACQSIHSAAERRPRSESSFTL